MIRWSKGLSLLSVMSVLAISSASYARPYDDFMACDDLRPRACGIAGTPSCKEVQQAIDECKQRAREKLGKEINEKGAKDGKK